MKISSEELGKLLVAFGTTLMSSSMQPDVSMISTPKEEPQSATITGAFDELPAPNQQPAVEAGTAGMENKLTNFHTQQNQSGLDLKPITL